MCGYCTPGFVTACQALLDSNPNPSLEDVKRGLDGNICRCGTYIGVFQAALAAAKAMKGRPMAGWPANPRLIGDSHSPG